MKVEERRDNDITRMCDLHREGLEEDIPGGFKEYQNQSPLLA